MLGVEAVSCIFITELYNKIKTSYPVNGSTIENCITIFFYSDYETENINSGCFGNAPWSQQVGNFCTKLATK